MVGISAYGAYIPLYRLGKETKGWDLPVEKAISSYDEDSITMAVAAVMDCLKGMDRQAVDNLLFGSTTSPYTEKQAASTIATAADLRTDILTGDSTNSLRAGTIALRMALDAIKAGSSKQVVVVAADCRKGPPKGSFDRNSGDGAAALLISKDEVAVEVIDSFSISHEMVDIWRPEGELFPRSWEDRFIISQGYQKVITNAITGLLEKNNLKAKDFTKAVFYGPDAGSHTGVGKALGFDPNSQIQNPMFGVVGCTGAAHALMLLVSCLEEAKPGDKILLANYGDGADAFFLQVTDQINKIKNRRAIKGHLQSKRILANYDTYLRWRQFVPTEAARRPPIPGPSASCLWRERDKNLRLYGGKCRECGTIQYPPQRVCTRCHTKDQFDPVRLAEKRGELFTYAMDYIAGAVDVPLVVSVVNFEGGGRMLCTMTDRDIGSIKIGMPVEMSFRKLFFAGGIHNYFWKCIPVREG
jgi:3-hydroxy-3-methylglutaryl CoA synthase